MGLPNIAGGSRAIRKFGLKCQCTLAKVIARYLQAEPFVVIRISVMRMKIREIRMSIDTRSGLDGYFLPFTNTPGFGGRNLAGLGIRGARCKLFARSSLRSMGAAIDA